MTPGSKLGPYEIVSPIGAGGMGEVWKARDSRLDRIVAVKVSKQEFRERFEREARAVAALNHPHICTPHDIGPSCLVFEYVDGQALKGPMRLDQALAYARANLPGARCRAQPQDRPSRPQTGEYSENLGRTSGRTSGQEPRDRRNV